MTLRVPLPARLVLQFPVPVFLNRVLLFLIRSLVFVGMTDTSAKLRKWVGTGAWLSYSGISLWRIQSQEGNNSSFEILFDAAIQGHRAWPRGLASGLTTRECVNPGFSGPTSAPPGPSAAQTHYKAYPPLTYYANPYLGYHEVEGWVETHHASPTTDPALPQFKQCH